MSFKSLLSNLCAATGTSLPSNGSNIDGTTGTSSSTSAPTTATSKKATWKEQTEQVWRFYQLSKSVKRNWAANEDTAEGSEDCGGGEEPQRIHLAICICVVDCLPQEHIWKSWLAHPSPSPPSPNDGKNDPTSSKSSPSACNPTTAGATSTAELFIHAKHPERIQSPWVKSKTIPHSYRPEWNDVRVVRAMLHLARLALDQPATTHVLFCTESCIPIATLDEISAVLLHSPSSAPAPPAATHRTQARPRFHPHRSFLQSYSRRDVRCTRFDERECWDKLQRHIPDDAIYKALPGWIVLCRNHIQSILKINHDITRNSTDGSLGACGEDKDDGLWRVFEKVWAPEEMFFPTALALLGHLPATQGNHTEVVNRSLMHSKWNHRALDERDRAHPRVYDGVFSAELVERIRNEDGCLFMRKFIKPLDIAKWEEVVLKKASTMIDGNTDMERMDTDYSVQNRRRQKYHGNNRAQDDSQGRYYDNNHRVGYRDHHREYDHRTMSRRRQTNQTSREGRRHYNRYQPYQPHNR